MNLEAPLKKYQNHEKVIEEFHTSLQAEKEALSLVCFRVENVEPTSSVISKIEKLQLDLAAKYKIMDGLAKKTQKSKVLYVKMTPVETCHSFFIVSVQKQLSNKLQLVALLNQIDGVSESGADPKQRGDKEPQPRQATEEQQC